MKPIVIILPIRTINPCNTREHWAVRSKRHASQRYEAYMAMSGGVSFKVLRRRFPHLIRVTLTRIGKRYMDTDGLAASFKAVRDGIAQAFGIDDGADFYEWRYEQEIGKEYAVRITIEERR